MSKSENDLVAWIAKTFPTRNVSAAGTPGGSPVAIGIGDDMAMVAAAGGRILVTTDMLMDGVHFDTATHSAGQIGRKALAVSLSDCAAMAVRPTCAVVSVALPDGWSMEQAQALFLGMVAPAEAYDCAIVGGDTNSWPRPLVINVAVIARPYEGIEPVRRDGARSGDELFVSGRLGGSLRGRHLTFEPRVREAHGLAGRLGTALHAMMDLSDGLSADAPRMAESSGCGLVFDELAIEGVASEAAHATSRKDGRSALDHALHDGEDFELLFAVGPGSMDRLVEPENVFEKSPPLNKGRVREGFLQVDSRSNPPQSPLHEGGSKVGSEGGSKGFFTRIGEAVEDPGVWLRSSAGALRPMERGGWQHFT